jgi:hypothetical protein
LHESVRTRHGVAGPALLQKATGLHTLASRFGPRRPSLFRRSAHRRVWSARRRPIGPVTSSTSLDPPPRPKPFLEVRVKELDLHPGLLAVCAGYELEKWRAARLAAHMIEWLPDFVLRDSERRGLRAENAVELIASAAHAVYSSEKYQRRGEAGELLLHIILRQVFGTTPAISKLFFKDSRNDTVKGFDSVHVTSVNSELELWLGEVKFYDDIASAIRDVVKELEQHSKADYLRQEFAAIANKIDPNSPTGPRLKALLDPNTSLDQVFARLCVPVLLSYDSATIAAHTKVTIAFTAAFEVEARKHHATFSGKQLPAHLRIHLLLLPLHRKADLLTEFDKRLKNAQGLA